MNCSLVPKISILVTSGLMIAAFGLALYLAFPTILDNQIKKRLILREGSEAYQYWKDVPVPIYIHFYFFNVTNPDEVYDLKKPVLEELGPYTFREERVKVNITFHENATVSYRQIKKWYFQPDKTVGSLNDNIISLNAPMIAAASTAKAMNEELVYFAIEEIFDICKSTWLIKKTVEELLFKGYKDKLLDIAQAFLDIPYDRFGWFYKRNDTDDGEFEVYTGADDIQTVDEVYTWNNEEEVAAYEPPCNFINGSAGDAWPPGLTIDDTPTIFITDICRSLSFTYLTEVNINDVRAFRYWADDTQLDNGKINPSNKCFCYDGNCLPAGAVNVSACKFNAPAVVSYPHFLFADSAYSDGVIGMKPNPSKHRMYLDLIPEMGVPLGVAARMQINLIFDPIGKITQFQNLTRRTYFPMFWFSETAEAGKNMIDKFKMIFITLPLISNIVCFILVAIGSLLVLTAFVLSLLYAFGKIDGKSRSLSKSPLIEDKVNSEKEPAYSTVGTDNK